MKESHSRTTILLPAGRFVPPAIWPDEATGRRTLAHIVHELAEPLVCEASRP